MTVIAHKNIYILSISQNSPTTQTTHNNHNKILPKIKYKLFVTSNYRTIELLFKPQQHPSRPALENQQQAILEFNK